MSIEGFTRFLDKKELPDSIITVAVPNVVVSGDAAKTWKSKNCLVEEKKGTIPMVDCLAPKSSTNGYV